jgi:hypothetical protein
MRPFRRAGPFVLALVLVGCGSAAPSTEAPSSAVPSASPSAASSGDPAACIAPQPTPELGWWNDRVFYEVFVRSFQDSDGDGVGDLRGLIDRLDYLNDGDPATTTDLGVTGIWLMPVFEAASYHGYDTVDYEAIERDYGSTSSSTWSSTTPPPSTPGSRRPATRRPTVRTGTSGPTSSRVGPDPPGSRSGTPSTIATTTGSSGKGCRTWR